MIKKLGRVFMLGGTSVVILLFILNLLLNAMPGGNTEWPSAVQNQITQDFFSRSSIDFIWDLLRGNFGFSISYPDQSVLELILAALKTTFSLAAPAVSIIFFMAFVFSMIGAIFKNSWVETLIDELFIVFLSLPILFLAPLLIFIFSIQLNLLPLAFLNSVQSYILPLFVLVARPLARFGILLKEKLIWESEQPYILVAQAKGLSPFQILWTHQLKGTLSLWVRSVGMVSLSLISGSFLVENLFSISGLGQLFVNALSERDYPVVAALVYFLGSSFIFLNLFLETFQEVIDPRFQAKEKILS